MEVLPNKVLSDVGLPYNFIIFLSFSTKNAKVLNLYRVKQMRCVNQTHYSIVAIC